MRTYKNNGERWYRTLPLMKRARQWFVWLGGWETSDGGWRFRLESKVHKGGRFWMTPFPVSVLGHRLTVYSWGLSVRTPDGWLTAVWRSHDGRRVYISPNGTPDRATEWIAGAPREVIREATNRRTPGGEQL